LQAFTFGGRKSDIREVLSLFKVVYPLVRGRTGLHVNSLRIKRRNVRELIDPDHGIIFQELHMEGIIQSFKRHRMPIILPIVSTPEPYAALGQPLGLIIFYLLKTL
jgi:hypothetical protein